MSPVPYSNDNNSVHSNQNSSDPEPDFINHELSATLDSSNAFEGPEKLLEVWFANSPEELPSHVPNKRKGLRSIPLNEIEELLDLVNCKILSKISTKEMDAYLLSESSLFVYPHKLILKTCGTTITLFCLSKLRQLSVDYLNFSPDDFKNIYRVFYSRRSLMFPQRQNEVHQSWSNELSWLNKYFPSKTGKAYIVGDLTKDHWYFYMNGSDSSNNKPSVSPSSSFMINNSSSSQMYPISPVLSNDSEMAVLSDDGEYIINQSSNSNSGCRPRATSFVDSSATDHAWKPTNTDETFELLMSDICPASAANFQLSKHENEFPSMDPDTEDYGHLLGSKMMADTCLDSIFAKSVITKIKHDAFAFTPCGFSSNSIINDKYYYTLHITPEQGWSYASFETNLPTTNKLKLTRNVIDVLQPGKFCLVFVQEISKNETNNNGVVSVSNINSSSSATESAIDDDSNTNESAGGKESLESLFHCNVSGYDRVDRIVLDLKFNYQLLYCYYEKKKQAA